MESSAINSRLKQHLVAAKLYTGQSVHGSKRGRCEYEQAKGTSMQELLNFELDKHSVCDAEVSQQACARGASLRATELGG